MLMLFIPDHSQNLPTSNASISSSLGGLGEISTIGQVGKLGDCIRVGFLDAEQPGAFGFLDPAVVIWGVHMIPGFAYGTCTDLLSPP